MASTSSSHQQNAFSGIEPPNKRRKVEESSKLYDVFINHRGPDVKQTLATKLYKSLEQVGVRAFLDSEEKELGTSFPSIIETAICSAKVHIAIFSKGYAHSPWCLAELVLMLQSKAKIIPLFYEVAPWELRYTEKGVYKDAFLGYKEKDRYLDKIKEWKEALQQVSYTAGYEFKSSDYGDCKEIVSAVEKEVQRRKHLHVANHPVGLHKLVKDFESRCLQDLVQDFESQCAMNRAGDKKANVVGIFGMGGVGKTTLSTELFNQKNSKYTRTSFLFDVREASASGKLPSLQSKLLKDIFGEDPSFVSSREGTSCLRDRFERSSSSSFLIVLDDIDHVEQLDALIPMDILNKHANNLVIVTTRDVGVLVTAEIDIVYHLKGLDREDGKELFCWHSFGQPNPCSGYEDLVEKFVNACGGLPLSLQVLGRHVYKKDLRYWREELEKVSKMLPGDVKKRLKISFDSLDYEERQIFMDVACFFIDKSKTIAMRIWEASGWSSHHALETLKEKCLVEEIYRWIRYFAKMPTRFSVRMGIQRLVLEDRMRLQDGSVLRMHDHLRDLGREMANELSHPRRVWQSQHLRTLGLKDILAQTKLRCFNSICDESMDCQITYFVGEPEDSSDTSLLWLKLHYRGFGGNINPSIPSWIPIQNVRGLRISDGRLQKLWQSDMQAPSHLRELRIRRTSLNELPDLSGISNNMEELLLDFREFQMDIWSLLGYLGLNLRSLSVIDSTLRGALASTDTAGRAKSLVIDNLKLPSEEELALNNERWSRRIMSGIRNLEIKGRNLVKKILITGNCCQRLQSLRICKMESLIEADLARINTLNFLEITECPELEELACLARLSCLEEIKIDNCEKLENIMLPTALIRLSLRNCRGLQRVEGDYTKLTRPIIEECPQFEKLPILCRASCLEQIKIDYCEKFENITLPATVIDLSVQRCRNLQRVVLISDLTKLTRLNIDECPELEELPSVARLTCLEQIKIYYCDKLKNITLPATLISLYVGSCRNLQIAVSGGDLSKLTRLNIDECPELQELPCLSREGCLEQIFIDSYDKLQNITLPTTVISLVARSCRNLQRISVNGDLTKLRQLHIKECTELQELPSLASMSCLEEIDIDSCEKLENITLPTILISLSAQSCRNLRSIAVNGDLTKLTRLYINDCSELEELPSLCRVSCLEQIVIDSCEKLQSIGGFEELHASEYMKLCYCSNTVIRNCIPKLKGVPSELDMIGRAVDGAELRIEDLFCDVNIGLHGIGTHGADCHWSKSREIIRCYVVVVDSSTSVEDINKSLPQNAYCYDSDIGNGRSLNIRQGEWIITMVGCDTYSYKEIENVLSRYGIMKKGYWVEVKNDEQWRKVMCTIADSLLSL